MSDGDAALLFDHVEDDVGHGSVDEGKPEEFLDEPVDPSLLPAWVM